MKEPIKTSLNADERLPLQPEAQKSVTAPEGEASGVKDDGPKSEDAVPVPLDEAIDLGFEKWLAARLSNSVLSRNTECWNLLRKEKDTLKGFIMKEVQ